MDILLHLLYLMKKILLFCIVFIIGLITSFLIITFQSYTVYNNQIRTDIAILQDEVSNNFIATSLDLKRATEVPELLGAFHPNTSASRLKLAKVYEQMIQNNSSYTQLRYIDAMGNEIVRVDQTDKGTTIVAQNELQNKAGRYYFSDTMKLGKNEYYISPLDLNVEGSKVIVPYEPTLRLATPVFDSADTKVGMVIINYTVKNVLSELEKKDDNNPLYHVYFTNSDGDWFRGPSPEDAWAYMFPDGEVHRVKKKFPLLWSKIITSDSGSVVTPEGYFYFGKIKPITLVQQNESIKESFSYFSRYLQVRDYYMVVIVHMPRELFSHLLLDQVIGVNILYILSTGIGLAFMSMLLARKKLR